eukprot:EG_transcript_50467
MATSLVCVACARVICLVIRFSFFFPAFYRWDAFTPNGPSHQCNLHLRRYEWESTTSGSPPTQPAVICLQRFGLSVPLCLSLSLACHPTNVHCFKVFSFLPPHYTPTDFV